jgi:glycine/D-amino acid oxidase-like deaminating enzyme
MDWQHRQLVIVGAGEAGVTLTLLLCRMAELGLVPDRFSISLLDRAREPLDGAVTAAAVDHASGYEYLKPGHRQTGIDCLHGALTKRLLFDPTPLETGSENRFLVSTDSVDLGITTFAAFEENVASMRSAYARAFDYVARGRKWTRQEAVERLGSDPDRFGVRLTPDEIADHPHVLGGYRSAGGSVRMANDYAIKRGLLDRLREQGRVRLLTAQQVRSIESVGHRYRVRTAVHELEADVVVIAAAHGTPSLARMVVGGRPSPAGTYHLNAMLFVRLEPTRDAERLRLMSRVNFVLQGEGGCMYACCLPPSASGAGCAAVYFPSPRGSQIERHRYDPAAPADAPGHWDRWIDHGLPDHLEQERVERVLSQLLRFNPFLDGCVSPLRLIPRTVFNPVVEANPFGTDTRVRQLIGSRALTDDGRVLTLTAPKWTNVELAALSAVEQILRRLWGMRLPRHPDGLGPERFDVERLAREVRFPDVRPAPEAVAHFQRRRGLPAFTETDERLSSPRR